MNIVLLGAPGAGKGTQAAKMIEALGVPHVSTGDILRGAVTRATPLGMQAKGFMDAGELVPDLVVIGLVKSRISEPDAAKGFILDGFPRTDAQAQALDRELAEMGKSLDAVISIEVDRDAIVQRLTSRRTCSQCGRITSVSEGTKCVTCGGELFQREDDTLDTVTNRLAVYDRETAPLIEYYRSAGKLREVSGAFPVEEVFASIKVILDA